MMREIQPAPRPRASDELVVPTLEVGAAVSRARRALVRARRIPGLGLLFLGSARRLLKITPPRVPALPWGVGLSPALLWRSAAGADRVEHPPLAPVGAAVNGAPHEIPARPAPAGLTASAPSEDRDLPRRMGSEVGLEAVAPALVLVRSLLGAAVREVRSDSRASVGPLEAARRRARGASGFLWSLAAARPAAQRSAGQPILGEGLSPRRSTAAGASRGEAARATVDENTSLPGIEFAVERLAPQPRSEIGFAPAAEALPWSERSLPRSPVNTTVEPMPHVATRRTTSESLPGRAAAGSISSVEMTPDPELPPLVAPTIARSRAAGLVEPGPRSAATAPPGSALPQRDPRVAAGAMRSLVEAAESVRALVAQEVNEAVGRIGVAARAPERQTPPQVTRPATNDALRTMLSRMRAITQEERFRSGKLR